MGVKFAATIISVFFTMTSSFVCSSNFNGANKSFSLGYTHRWDSLRWNFGDVEGVPNILSELIWEDLCINQVTAAASLKMCSGLFFKGSGGYGRIYSGSNRDSDYAEDDRMKEFSRAISSAGRGEVFDLSAAIGYQVAFYCGRLKITPLIGASWSEQHLQMFDGEQLIPFEKKIDGLHSSYKTRWYGPWVGLDCSIQVYECITVFASLEYHLAVYKGRGHWNLRTDFLTDFKHDSGGDGVYLMSGLSYSLDSSWKVDFIASYQDWEADSGSHRLTVEVPDSGPEKIVTRLNQASWTSFALTSLLTYTF